VEHPFHPLYGEVFEVISCSMTWGEERVMFEDHKGCTRTLPVSWTSLAAPDPFVATAQGRSAFRLVDLLQLARLVRELSEQLEVEGRDGVM
jgi:hypothetical protein